MTEKEKADEELSKKIDAHCFHCGKQLILKGAYFECPDHGRKWIPDNVRF
mgnify:CR=1 FL=1